MVTLESYLSAAKRNPPYETQAIKDQNILMTVGNMISFLQNNQTFPNPYVNLLANDITGGEMKFRLVDGVGISTNLAPENTFIAVSRSFSEEIRSDPAGLLIELIMAASIYRDSVFYGEIDQDDMIMRAEAYGVETVKTLQKLATEKGIAVNTDIYDGLQDVYEDGLGSLPFDPRPQLAGRLGFN